MASILKQYREPFLAQEESGISPHVRSTLRRIDYCRTAALGGRVYQCPACENEVPMYNSCGDRHCPTCAGAQRADWVDGKAELLHPGVTYFQGVFTIPAKLSSIVLGNREACYRLLFQAAWRALEESIRLECGMQPAAAMMLHTWNQRLGHHPHVHALIPGSGPSLAGTSWVPCRQTKGTRAKAPTPFLVDNKRLGRRFRDQFLEGLRRFHRRGKLKLTDDQDLESMLSDLQERDWVVFIEPPPRVDCRPEQVLKYLARYLTGGPISDRRLIGMKGDEVTFWARAEDKSGRQESVTLSGIEFTRRWSLHILPPRFTKTRSFGGWSHTRRKAYQALCQGLSPEPQTSHDDQERPVTCVSGEPETEDVRCPKCQSPMALVWSAPRPSWRDLFYGTGQPSGAGRFSGSHRLTGPEGIDTG